MLVITRRKGESLVIGENVRLTVVEVQDDKVRLGIVAPTGVPIQRLEFLELIRDRPTLVSRSAEEAGLLRAILDDPADDVPRLIYADWLEDRGDPRGEFIRVQCELASLDGDDPRRQVLRERERGLLQENEAAWRSALPLGFFHGPFVRGFVQGTL